MIDAAPSLGSRRYHRLTIATLICLLLSFIQTSFVEAKEREEVTIGVLAKRGAAKTTVKWGATAAYLTQRLPNYSFRIVPMPFDDIPILVKNQLMDFVIVNSGIYIDLAHKYRVQRVLTMVNQLSPGINTTHFGSVIFTRSDNKRIHSLDDLEKQRVAAVHSTSLGGWIMALSEIRKAGLDEYDFASLEFLNTHDDVVQAILERRADVGIVRTDTLERMEKEGKIRTGPLHVINEQQFSDFPYAVSTPLYPEWPIAKLPHTSSELARQVAVALLQMPTESTAAKNAKINGWNIPENYQPVRDVLQQLALSPFDHDYRITLKAAIKTYWYWTALVIAIMLLLGFLLLRVSRLNKALNAQQIDMRQNEERLHATFEQAAVGIAHTNASGQILRLNQKICEITGYSARELKEMNLNDLISGEDLATEIQNLDMLRSGQSSNISVQLRLLRPDQSDKWIMLNISSIKDEQGRIKYLVAVMNDLDQLKRLEEEARRSEQQKKLILDIAGDGILGLDLNANHTFVNPAAARMLGYEVDEMLNKNSHKMWHHSHADGSGFRENECPITHVLAKGLTHRGKDEVFWRKDGSSFQAEYTSTPIIENEVITGAVVIFRKTVKDTATAID
ncbi:MAG: diguanylate cyclase [Gammaproteobacteria bacterium (ex Lamellibrachia satsuma)]|nr:MAG: PhnD/SsuA/transferrin family substrate-binding protein [Gammaproteobacteria bacterium (ex Lamellibrachia satsuma)]RRS34011.1 MAG: diguanylate cyclase [Gammaproteobacteria bacterium (ex Lamellibrachia satsuma)]RRS35553.1 MAG: diguanylate cyclase [Gammaproteobacteria bacterium (ex Lamellibrachia satsuma)]